MLVIFLVALVVLIKNEYSKFIFTRDSHENYWKKTKISQQILLDLLEPAHCNSSKKNYLACSNAIISVASRYNLDLTLDGQLKQETLKRKIITEKEQMKLWEEFYISDHAKAIQISFLKIWNILKQKHIKDSEASSYFVGKAINGFLSLYRDPHTYLLPIDFYNEVISNSQYRVNSLGFAIGENNHGYYVKKVFPGSDAERSGLLKGDVIYAINGRNASQLMMANIQEILKGQVGKEIYLKVIRGSQKYSIDLRITETWQTSVASRVQNLSNHRIGVVMINKFSKGTCEQLKVEVSGLIQQKVEGLFLDLRDNPGGQMNEAACVASLFVGHKLIYEIHYMNQENESERHIGDEEAIYNGPVAVLINGGTASASEIVAGVLKDYGRATLVGTRTFGKGSFQEGEVWRFNQNIALFETKGFYYLPSGYSPQIKGIHPDIYVEEKENDLREADLYFHPLRAPIKAMKRVEKISAQPDSNIRLEQQASKYLLGIF